VDGTATGVGGLSDAMTQSPAPLRRRDDNRLFKTLQQRFRRRRFARIEAIIEKLIERSDKVRILDVGGRAEYWNMLAPHLRAQVHLTIVNYEAELAAYSDRVEEGLQYEHVAGNACNMPQYGDGSFDLVHSNSVIEHVGSYANMLAFAREIRRVGKAYYVQTPNFWFPIDPHIAFPFLHWMPDPVRLFAFIHFKLGVARKVDFAGGLARMDDCRMISRRFMRALFPDAQHSRERFALVFSKSLIATGGC